MRQRRHVYHDRISSGLPGAECFIAFYLMPGVLPAALHALRPAEALLLTWQASSGAVKKRSVAASAAGCA